jgi:hypothetical protein
LQAIYKPPIISFTKTIKENGGVLPKQLHHLLVWMIKLILFEPLRLTELAIFNRKIEACIIDKPPLFILGHYRSGTTYLQRLLAQDKQFGYQTIFHSGLPELMLGFEGFIKPVLSFITKLTKAENKFHKVPFTWDFPGEEDVALTAFSYEDSAQWGVLYPYKYEEYFKKYISFSGPESNANAWVKNYCYFLKKLYIKNKFRRLILKSPPNTARIPLLLHLFPDAQFIHIYRNPYDVFASSKRFWQIINRYYALRPVEEAKIPQLIIHTYSSMMSRYLETKNLIPHNQLMEVQFEALTEKPMKSLEMIYSNFNIKNFEPVQKELLNL